MISNTLVVSLHSIDLYYNEVWFPISIVNNELQNQSLNIVCILIKTLVLKKISKIAKMFFIKIKIKRMIKLKNKILFSLVFSKSIIIIKNLFSGLKFSFSAEFDALYTIARV